MKIAKTLTGTVGNLTHTLHLVFKPHKWGPSSWHCVIRFRNQEWISIILGDDFYSNGKDTYEVWSSYAQKVGEEPLAYANEGAVVRAYVATFEGRVYDFTK